MPNGIYKQAKANNAPSSFLDYFADISVKGQSSIAFPCFQLTFTPVSECKDTKFLRDANLFLYTAY